MPYMPYMRCMHAACQCSSNSRVCGVGGSLSAILSGASKSDSMPIEWALSATVRLAECVHRSRVQRHMYSCSKGVHTPGVQRPAEYVWCGGPLSWLRGD